MDIKPGDLVEAVTATGSWVSMRALTGPEMGQDFAIVWVCTESEWETYEEPEGIPWPADHVRLLETA